MSQPRPITPSDLWNLPRVGSPVPLPDASALIVPVTRYDPESSEARTRLWRIAAEGTGSDTAPRALTRAEDSSSAPAVSADGRRLAFLRKPGGKAVKPGDGAGPRYPDKPQVFVQPLDGGEAERVTDLPLGASSPRWLPDGRLAFAAGVFREDPSLEGTAELAKEREKDKVKARVTEDRVYRFWDQWLTEGKIDHLCLLDLETDHLIDLTPRWSRWIGLFSGDELFDVAPDGRELAFGACRTEPPHSPILFGVFTLPIPAKGELEPELPEPELLHPDHEAPARGPRYSPDSRWLVYGKQYIIGFYADRVRLVARDRVDGAETVLTESWDNSSDTWVFGQDPNQLIIRAQNGAHDAIWSLDLAATIADPDANPPAMLAEGGSIGALRPAGGGLFTTLNSLSAPPELAMLAPGASELERISDFCGEGMSELSMGATEERFFSGADEDQVQMFLVHPPEGAPDLRNPDGALPLVHLVHGGPHGVFGDGWHWRWSAQAMAARGYLVALVNFHGSTGFGEDYTKSILGQWGDRPGRDVLRATDLLIDEGLADPERMAIAGGSYGGYLVSWLAGETDRYQCIVNHAGVCDFQTQFASDITQGRRRSMGGELWDDLEGLDRFNPIRRADRFQSPMLVIHGTRDYRVPYNQGLVIYNVYKARDLPARLVVYEDENHWILKRHNSLHWYEEVFGWFERWLLLNG